METNLYIIAGFSKHNYELNKEYVDCCIYDPRELALLENKTKNIYTGSTAAKVR